MHKNIIKHHKVFTHYIPSLLKPFNSLTWGTDEYLQTSVILHSAYKVRVVYGYDSQDDETPSKMIQCSYYYTWSVDSAVSKSCDFLPGVC